MAQVHLGARATCIEVVIEDPCAAAMKRSMGRRAFRRSVPDASCGMYAPMLGYKAGWTGVSIMKADRWVPSSRIRHGCGCRLIVQTTLATQLVCQVPGEMVGREINAARNLRDQSETTTSPGLAEADAPVDTEAASDNGTDPGSDRGRTCGRTSDRKTGMSRTGRAETRTKPANRQTRTPERGAA